MFFNRTIPGKSSKSLLFCVKCRFVAGSAYLGGGISVAVLRSNPDLRDHNELI
jgi:hypothetical protein